MKKNNFNLFTIYFYVIIMMVTALSVVAVMSIAIYPYIDKNIKEDKIYIEEPFTLTPPKASKAFLKPEESGIKILNANYKEIKEDLIPAYKEKAPTANKQNKEELYKMAIISKVIWCEDRRDEKGMRLVLSVIHNRAKEKTIDGLYEVVKKPRQFECYPKVTSKKHKITDKERYKLAKKLVAEYRANKFKPITNAKYFINPKILGFIPVWAKNKKTILAYNGHVYYE